MNQKLEAETREAIQANHSLMRDGLGISPAARALKILEARLERAGLPSEAYLETRCRMHKWITPELRCLACGADCEAKPVQFT